MDTYSLCEPRIQPVSARGLYRTARVGLVTPLRDGIGFGRRHSRQPLRAGGYPSLASGHHGTKLTAYGSHPTTQTERSESFETA